MNTKKILKLLQQSEPLIDWEVRKIGNQIFALADGKQLLKLNY
jgi:hypothetical protein